MSEFIFEKKDPTSKEKIILSAMELFARNGFIPTTVDSIAKKAGLSKGSIYNYFKSKEEIFKAIISTMLEFSDIMISEIKKIKEPLEKLENIIAQSAEFCKRDPEFARMYTSCFFQPELYALVKEIITDFYIEWKEVITGIFRDLKHKEPEQEARIFLALLDGLQLHYLFEIKDFDIDTLSKNIIQKYRELYKQGVK
ncbi:MAG: TetR/AcrR family transcriptional regulator [Candidatus Delongbacteria bacterium]|jgi:AcrR family transcriptional regulator|nr:TetR/AcrR family transcriptional regulator [Candidatus Delongbacteria bacterium]